LNHEASPTSRYASGTRSSRWSRAILLSAALYAFVMPLVRAFPSDVVSSLRPVLWGITALFAVDLVARLRRARVGGRGVLRAYLKRWFVVDALAALPLSFTPWVVVGPGVLGLLKLARVGQAMRGWQLNALRYSSPLPLLFAVFWLVVAVHWICSGWMMLRGFNVELGVVANYIDSLYWTVTTLTAVGYGDITPADSVQKLYAVGTMVVGLAFLGYMIGFMASMLSRRDPSRALFQENIEQLSVAAQYGGIPQDLQRRVYDYYAYLWRQRLGYNESDFLSSLPQGLKEEVSRHLKGHVLERIDLFREADPDLVGQVALRLQPEVLTPGDYVFREGDDGASMYFIAGGEFEVLQQAHGQPVAKLGVGDFFGEIALFSNQPRSASVRARTYCDVYSLSKNDFERIFRRFPETVAEIEHKARSRQQRDEAAR